MSSKKSLLIVLIILLVFCFLAGRILKLSHHKRTLNIPYNNLKIAKYLNSISRVITEETKKISGTPDAGTLGVVFYDLKLNKSIGINADKEFPAASLIKVPVLIEFYNQVNQGKINPQTQIILKEKDKVSGGGILRHKPAGSKFTLEKLAELMITESDNTATDILIKLLGFYNINKTIKELGCKNTFIKRTIWDFDAVKTGKDNVTTPEDMTLILRKLYRGEVLNKEISNKILNIMKKTKRRDMIPAGLPRTTESHVCKSHIIKVWDKPVVRGLPKEVVVAHKTGELAGMVHDVGIVYCNDNPYILCLLSKNVVDVNKTIKIWSELSKKIYEIINNF